MLFRSHQAKAVEEASKAYFGAKLTRLGLPSESLLALPKVHYTIPQASKDKNRAGSFDPMTEIAQVFPSRNANDFFHGLRGVPHELSHASVSRSIEYYFPDGDPKRVTSAHAEGLAFIEDHVTRGKGI